MEYELMRLRGFIEENWAKFEAFCAENGDNADEILEELEKHLD
jgi:hypothetical protein